MGDKFCLKYFRTSPTVNRYVCVNTSAYKTIDSPGCFDKFETKFFPIKIFGYVGYYFSYKYILSKITNCQIYSFANKNCILLFTNDSFE